MDVKDFVKTHNFTNGTTTAIIPMVVKLNMELGFISKRGVKLYGRQYIFFI